MAGAKADVAPKIEDLEPKAQCLHTVMAMHSILGLGTQTLYGYEGLFGHVL